MENVGKYAFLAGLLIALVAGVMSLTDLGGISIALVLVVLGVIIGVLNIQGKETVRFMVAALLLGTAAGVFAVIGIGMIDAILSNVAALAIPAGIVVALKELWDTAK